MGHKHSNLIRNVRKKQGKKIKTKKDTGRKKLVVGH
jgi:hypothetical protein